MNELELFIKRINLFFTNTVSINDVGKVPGIDYINTKVNYENTISLYNLVKSFNELYLKFKKEYDRIEKIELGEYVEIIEFSKYHSPFDDKDYRHLVFYIENPSISKHKYTYLYLFDKNNEPSALITSNTTRNSYEEGYYREKINLNLNIVSKYLDLFSKYQVLLDTYNYLKNQFIFGDSSNILSSSIDGDLLKGLDSIKINLGSIDFFSEDIISLYINLGENFGINYQKSSIILNNNIINFKNNDIDKIFNDTLINKTYLKKRK